MTSYGRLVYNHVIQRAHQYHLNFNLFQLPFSKGRILTVCQLNLSIEFIQLCKLACHSLNLSSHLSILLLLLYFWKGPKDQLA